MLGQLSALISWMRATATGFQNFIGTYVSGGATQMGPFLGVAPEAIGAQGPNFPYMVYDILAQGMDLGFGGVGTSYADKPIIRFHLYGTNPDDLAANLEKFTAALDVVTPANVGCAVVLRKDNPTFLPEPIGPNGARVYHAMTTYEFWTNRNKGTET